MKPMSPPAANSTSEDASAARSGRCVSPVTRALTSAIRIASVIGSIARPPPKRISQVSSR